MPKQTPSIPNEVLWARLGDRSALSDELWLIAAQVGMLLGRSTDQLAEDRKIGNPPPFKKDGGSIRYRLGSVRDHKLGLPEFNNTTQARLSVERNKFGSFSNLHEWEAHAKPADLWPFLIRRGEPPIDFWKSLTLGADLSDDDQCVLINFDEYRILCRDSSQSREPEAKTVKPRDESGSMREKFVRFLDEVRQVRRTPEEALFNSLLQQHHYLGYTQPVGEHLKYLVLARGRPVACLAWCSAPRHLGSRDRFIGWGPQARLQNIRLLAYNTRFLILPWVTVPHLASHLLGRMARRLSADWQSMYGHPIYFLETFIERQRLRGTCYRAANWQLLKRTTGRGKDAPTHEANRSIKEVLGYALVKDFRQRLSQVA